MMMFFSRLLTWFLLLPISAAFARGSSSPKAVRAARDAEVTCADLTRCSPSAGMLTYVSRKNFGVCSFTLIASDLALTSAHCVPTDVRDAEESCRERIFLHFAEQPEHPNYEETADCERVALVTTAGPNAGAAILKIKPVKNRPALRVSRTGFADQELFMMDKIDAKTRRGKISGRQVQVGCRAYQHSYVAPEVTDSTSPTGLLSDCEQKIIAGNSGAGVRDATGALRGALFDHINGETLTKLRARWAQQSLREPPKMAEMNLAVNLACSELPREASGEEPPAACKNGEAKGRADSGRNAQLQQRLKPVFDSLLKHNYYRRWLRWTARREASKVILQPDCVNTFSARPERTVAVGSLRFNVSTELDPYGRVAAAQVQPASIFDEFVTIRETPGGKFLVDVSGEQFTVPACP